MSSSPNVCASVRAPECRQQGCGNCMPIFQPPSLAVQPSHHHETLVIHCRAEMSPPPFLHPDSRSRETIPPGRDFVLTETANVHLIDLLDPTESMRGGRDSRDLSRSEVIDASLSPGFGIRSMIPRRWSSTGLRMARAPIEAGYPDERRRGRRHRSRLLHQDHTSCIMAAPPSRI